MKFQKGFLVVALLMVIGISNLVQAAAKKTEVGILMPTRTSLRWPNDGNNMLKMFKEKGIVGEAVYAEDDVPNQIKQIEAMIDKGVKVMVIAPVDGSKLSPVLQKAASKGIKVIAYDRMIQSSKDVDYYVSFDNFQVGVLQASSLVAALKLQAGKGPFNIELFAGSPDDNNSVYFFNGAMSVLNPYLKSGKLVVRSKQITLDKVSTLRWDGIVARARMDTLFANFYTKDRLDAILSPYDGMSVSLMSSQRDAGYGTPKQPYAFVSGQDAEVSGVKSIIRGEMYSTIFKDTRELAKATVDMVVAIQSGKQPKVTDSKSFNNGGKIVPANLLTPVLVDKSNWKRVLVDSGYYTEDRLN